MNTLTNALVSILTSSEPSLGPALAREIRRESIPTKREWGEYPFDVILIRFPRGVERRKGKVVFSHSMYSLPSGS